MGKTKLINLSARAKKVASQDLNDEKTNFVVGPLSARQLFAILAKHEEGTAGMMGNKKMTGKALASGAMLAMDMCKYGLKEVKGELGVGFKLEDDDELGFKCKAVSDDYLDVLPIEISMEIGGYVGEMSQAGKNQKKG
jgi:hypothetical protein